MRIWKWLLGPWLALVIVAAFVYAGEAEGFVRGAGRIIFFHVPQSMLAVVGFVISLIYALRYLIRRDMLDDIKSETGAELGLLCCVLATLTGSIFAKIQWGSYWHWDARETSILVLLLIYGAYFALRASVEEPERRARLAAIYAIFACIVMPFLVFVVPRIPALNSLHPQGVLTTREGLSPSYRIVLYSSFLGFGGLFAWLFDLAVRVRRLAATSEVAETAAPAAVLTKVRQ
jgi:heme exporter protein C